MREVLKQAQTRLQSLEKGLKEIENAQKGAQAQSRAHIVEIEMFFEVIEEYLKERGKTLISRVDSMYNNREKSYDQHQGQLTTLSNDVKNAVGYVEKTLEDCNEVFFLQMRGQLIARLNELNKKTITLENKEKEKTVRVIDVVEEGAALKKFVDAWIQRKAGDFTSLDKPMLIFGSKGNANASLGFPMGIAVNNQSHFIVADRGNKKVKIFDKNGLYIGAFGKEGELDGEFKLPWGVCSNEEHIVVSDFANNSVQVFDHTGKFLRKLYAKGKHGYGKFRRPRGVAIDYEGRIFVVERNKHRVQVFSADGSFFFMFGEEGQKKGQFSKPNGVAIDRQGNIIVADGGNNRVQIFSKNGKFLHKFKVKSPFGVAYHSQGKILVTEVKKHQVKVYGEDGTLLHKFGSQGSGPGQFGTPFGIIVDRKGRIVVADQSNHRVQIF